MKSIRVPISGLRKEVAYTGSNSETCEIFRNVVDPESGYCFRRQSFCVLLVTLVTCYVIEIWHSLRINRLVHFGGGIVVTVRDLQCALLCLSGSGSKVVGCLIKESLSEMVREEADMP